MKTKPKKPALYLLGTLLLTSSVYGCGCHDAGGEKVAVKTVEKSIKKGDKIIADPIKEMQKQLDFAFEQKKKQKPLITTTDFITKLEALENAK